MFGYRTFLGLRRYMSRPRHQPTSQSGAGWWRGKNCRMLTADELIAAHSREVYTYLYRYVGNAATAEDILGEVFVRFVGAYPSNNSDEFNWRAWFYKVATNLAISHFRRERIRKLFRMRQRADEYSLKGTIDSPHTGVEQDQEVRLLKAAVEKLSDKLRSVIIMRTYNDMSYDEIAYTLNLNVGTVKSRLNEAKARLKELLEVSDGD